MDDLNDKITGGNLAASEWNQPASEIQNVIEATGQALSGADLDQLGKGVAMYSSKSNFFIGSGVADVYIATPTAGYQAPTSYQQGMLVRFRPNVANTGASTINVNSLGVKNIKKEDGSALVAGELDTDRDAWLTYDGTDFLLSNWSAQFIAATPFAPPGYLTGLESAKVDNDNFSIDTGQARDFTDAQTIILASMLTKSITTPGWVAGDTNSGIPTGVVRTDDTWYALFVIYRNSDGAVDVGIDTSLTAINLLADSGYDLYRRVGWIKTGAAGAIEDYRQLGDQFMFLGIPNTGSMFSGDPGTGADVFRADCPPGVYLVNVSANLDATSGKAYLWLIPGDVPASYGTPSSSNHNVSGENGVGITQVTMQTDSSGQLAVYRSSQSINGLRILGGYWFDRRGKDGEA